MDIDLERMLPAGVTIQPRTPLTKGRRYRRVSHFPSLKNHASIGCSAVQHVDFCTQLEYEPAIVSYASRPCVITFKQSGYCYRPDFCAVFQDARIVFYELSKPSSTVLPCEKHRNADVRRQFGEAGILFELIELSRLNGTQRIKNLRYLYHHALTGSLDGGRNVLAYVVSRPNRSTTVQVLLDNGCRVEDIACALFNRLIQMNLNLPFSLDRRVGVECHAHR